MRYPTILLTLAFVIIHCHCLPSLEHQNLISASQTAKPPRAGISNEAYVTVLHDKESILGVRVLGQSLRESKTTRDLVVLVTEGISESVRTMLYLDGWHIISIKALHGSYSECRDSNYYFTRDMSVLLVWRLVQYQKVVFLDTDTLVLSNVDSLFTCGQFCAAFRHCNLFNSHVMVIQPNVTVFNDMVRHLCSHASYDGAVKGFLNEYFVALLAAKMFNSQRTNTNNSLMRLPSVYNGDIGTYLLGSHWVKSVSTFKIIQYSMGLMRPWMWWSYIFFDVNWKWNEFRRNLQNDESLFLLTPSCWLHLFLLSQLLLFYRFWYPHYCSIVSKDSLITAGVAYFLMGNCVTSFVYPVLVALFSYYVAFSMVPQTMHFYLASLVFLTWILFCTVTFYGFCCHLAYVRSLTYRYSRQKRNKTYLNRKTQTFMILLLYIILWCILFFGPSHVKGLHKRIGFFFLMCSMNLVLYHKLGRHIIKVWSR